MELVVGNLYRTDLPCRSADEQIAVFCPIMTEMIKYYNNSFAIRERRHVTWHSSENTDTQQWTCWRRTSKIIYNGIFRLKHNWTELPASLSTSYPCIPCQYSDLLVTWSGLLSFSWSKTILKLYTVSANYSIKMCRASNRYDRNYYEVVLPPPQICYCLFYIANRLCNCFLKCLQACWNVSIIEASCQWSVAPRTEILL